MAFQCRGHVSATRLQIDRLHRVQPSGEEIQSMFRRSAEASCAVDRRLLRAGTAPNREERPST